jgi:hypothetical protein
LKILGYALGLAFLSGAGGNFGSELQLESRRCSLGLQKTLALVPGLARSLRRRVSLTLHDMQGFDLDGSRVKSFISR